MRPSSRISSSVQLINRKLTSSSANKSKVNEKHNKSIHLVNNNNHQTTLNPQHAYPSSHHHYNSSKSINMQTIFQANKEYLMQKIKISQVPIPSKYYRKIPSRTPNTTYNKEYIKNMNNISNSLNQIKIQRKDNLEMFNSKKAVTAYNTFYNNDYNKSIKDKLTSSNTTNGVNTKNNTNQMNIHNYMNNSNNNTISQLQKSTPLRADLLKREQQKQYNMFIHNQAPSFHNTSYKLDYNTNNNHPVKVQKSTKQSQNKLMGGGVFKGESTYNNVYKENKKSVKKSQPIYQVNSPFQSTYNKQFTHQNNNHHQNNNNGKNNINNNDKKRSKTIFYQQKPIMSSRNPQNPEPQPIHSNTARKLSTPKNTSTSNTNCANLKNNNNNYNNNLKQIQRKKYKTQYERSYKNDQKSKSKNNSSSLMTIQAMKKLILNVL